MRESPSREDQTYPVWQDKNIIQYLSEYPLCHRARWSRTSPNYLCENTWCELGCYSQIRDAT